MRLAQALAREGRDDEAGDAVLTAEECGADGGEVLESIAPSWDAPIRRVLDGGPRRPGAMPCLAWTRDGKTLLVLEHAPDGTAGIVAWDVVHAKARTVSLNLRLPKVIAMVHVGGDQLLVAYESRARALEMALVTRGFVQPPIGAEHEGFHELAATRDLVAACDGTRLRAWLPPYDEPVWTLKRHRVSLGELGTAVTLTEKGELALHEPLAKKPRRKLRLERDGAIFAVRRRALVLVERSLLLVDGDKVRERSATSRPDALRPAPSGAQTLLLHVSSPPLLLDMRSGKESALPFGFGYLHAAAWAPSGRRLALAGPDGELVLLEPA